MATTSSSQGSAAPLPPLTPGPYRKRLGLISIVACFGGLLFGYDTGVINGALRPMAEELGLSPFTEGVVTSSLVFAAAAGALSCGRLSDGWGRRRTILLLAVLFFVGTAFVVFTPGFEVLVVGRILLGLAVGGASTVVPVFLAEMAPYEIRGSIAGRNEVGHPLRPWVILFLVVAFVGSMQTFLNVAVWVYLSEVFPLHMRGLGTGVSIFMLWTTNGFLSLYFPSLVAAVGITGTFFLFAAVGALALLFVATQVPETRGRTLEALEEDVTTGAIYTVKTNTTP